MHDRQEIWEFSCVCSAKNLKYFEFLIDLLFHLYQHGTSLLLPISILYFNCLSTMIMNQLQQSRKHCRTFTPQQMSDQRERMRYTRGRQTQSNHLVSRLSTTIDENRGDSSTASPQRPTVLSSTWWS